MSYLDNDCIAYFYADIGLNWFVAVYIKVQQQIYVLLRDYRPLCCFHL